ncbi:MAG TPA: C-type lectin domain-containing protein [Kofleriaceae bacterium]|nr:C-type lectin domain-containing protein [Kofleriaceae bacterium]
MRWLAVVLALGGCDGVFGLRHVGEPSDASGSASSDGRPLVRPDGDPGNCPASYSFTLPTTASRYRVVLEGKDWLSAEAACAADMPGSTHLIVLSVPGEWDALGAQSEIFLTNFVWVGLSDRKTEGTFIPVTHEDTNGYPAAMKTPWAPGLPTNGGADCAQMEPVTGLLHDISCTDSQNYICECDRHADDPTLFP